MWDAYAHNDYLETLITFGSVGFGVIAVIVIAILFMPFFGDGMTALSEFIVLIGLTMAGMLIHARYDLPFQVYGLHFEFFVLCVLVTCLKWEKP